MRPDQEAGCLLDRPITGLYSANRNGAGRDGRPRHSNVLGHTIRGVR